MNLTGIINSLENKATRQRKALAETEQAIAAFREMQRRQDEENTKTRK